MTGGQVEEKEKEKTSDAKAIPLSPPMKRWVPSQFLSKIWLTSAKPLTLPFDC